MAHVVCGGKLLQDALLGEEQSLHFSLVRGLLRGQLRPPGLVLLGSFLLLRLDRLTFPSSCHFVIIRSLKVESGLESRGDNYPLATWFNRKIDAWLSMNY